MKRMLIAALCLLLLLSPGCQAAAPAPTPTPAPTATPTPSPSPTPEPTLLETVQAGGVLKISLSPDYPPYEFLNRDGQPTGSDVRLAEYLAQGLGLTLELLPAADLDSAIAAVDAGSAHLVISCLGDTPERRAAYAVSDPYGGTPAAEEADEAPAETPDGAIVISADYSPIPMEDGLVILGQAGDETLMEAINELIYVLNRNGLYAGYLNAAILEADALRLFD